MKSLEESRLRKALAEGLVSMRYVKRNGDTRNAVGTLNMTLIPSPHHPSPRRGGPKMPRGLVRYYDFTVQAWRSLYCDEILEWKRLEIGG